MNWRAPTLPVRSLAPVVAIDGARLHVREKQREGIGSRHACPRSPIRRALASKAGLLARQLPVTIDGSPLHTGGC